MEDILVSVIIPVYKVEKYLNQCIDSVLNQTYKNIEVILVDDGSPDTCPRICDEYAKNDRRIKVIHKTNGGSSSAREAGMTCVTGDYVMFVDGDDWIDLKTIEICMNEIERNSEIECILFSYVKESLNASLPMKIMDQTVYLSGSEAEEKVYRRLFGLSNEELSHPERMENMVSCCMKLYRVKYARKGKYFDTQLVGSCEDGLFNMYALYNCNHILYLDIPLYHYRKAGNSLTSSFRPYLVKQWGELFFIMERIIEEKQLGQVYQEALSNRIALSITAIGLNELSNSAHGVLEHLKIIRNYLNQDKFRSAVRQLKIRNMPLAWKLLMVSCKLRCTFAVYMALVAINIIRKR